MIVNLKAAAILGITLKRCLLLGCAPASRRKGILGPAYDGLRFTTPVYVEKVRTQFLSLRHPLLAPTRQIDLLAQKAALVNCSFSVTCVIS